MKVKKTKVISATFGEYEVNKFVENKHNVNIKPVIISEKGFMGTLTQKVVSYIVEWYEDDKHTLEK
ncbi:MULTISPECIES: hypothetical protein [Lactococcus]|uniref:hypothetical protein n=1 Tax=Lactococcus TaxID=1357 RepID=UPI002434A35B|nr:hypothetical protein [Lactococcus formosensis]MDG6143776.1 hypothetical protein [Lactococcus formosensis]